ncbi:hypothetical protein OHJ21_31720 [Virgibacillus sp. LDC1]|uniref:hypothetical protein n=1 Tax=unclassified Paenibacillus TaxID=185978 RepID=UPI0013FE20F6|nr:hypothetical protein [Paenibacillus sp. GM2FR]MCV4235741.1 hypothetical protein [Virgibacillus sp. LDC1]
MFKALSWCCSLAFGIFLTGAVGEPLRKHNLYNTGLRPLPQVFFGFPPYTMRVIQTSHPSRPEAISSSFCDRLVRGLNIDGH